MGRGAAPCVGTWGPGPGGGRCYYLGTSDTGAQVDIMPPGNSSLAGAALLACPMKSAGACGRQAVFAVPGC